MAAGHDIFISYASVDRERVRALAGLFQAQGWSVWWDPEIAPGEPFDRVIKRALDGARVVVVVWSRASVESDWVLAEAEEGRKRRILVPVMLETAEIPLGFSRLQAAGLAGWSGDPGHTECRKLLGRIAALLRDGAGEARRAPDAPPDPPVDRRRRRRLFASAAVAGIAVLAGAAYLGAAWYEGHRFERALTVIREQIRDADEDRAQRRNREARKKLDAARRNIAQAEKLRPDTWQVKELRRLHSMAQRRLWGVELGPQLILISDCEECPELVDVPAGRFKMGSADTDNDAYPAERPQRLVTIARPFAIGRFEVTVREFEAFVRAENHAPTGDCRTYVHPGKWERDLRANWKWPQFEQGPDHPVACVSWLDAVRYTAWLSRKTGRTYRLPTEAEWEYVARAGSEASRYWGDDPKQACAHANVADRKARVPWAGHDCDDDEAFTAPVGTYPPNAFQVFDMIGNVWEWVQDCFAEDYAKAPGDGSAVAQEGCKFRVIRGGAWLSRPRDARVAQRGLHPPQQGNYSVGFRVVREP